MHRLLTSSVTLLMTPTLLLLLLLSAVRADFPTYQLNAAHNAFLPCNTSATPKPWTTAWSAALPLSQYAQAVQSDDGVVCATGSARNGGFVVALSAANGAVLWQRALGPTVTCSIATAAQGVLYTWYLFTNSTGFAVALNTTTGALLWSNYLASSYQLALGAPVLLDSEQALYFSASNALFGVDARTGSNLFVSASGSQTGYIQPSYDGTTPLLYSLEGDSFSARSPDTGQVVWSISTPSYQQTFGVAAPVYGNTSVFLYQPTSATTSTVAAIDLTRRATRWTRSAACPNPSTPATPVIAGAVVYVNCQSSVAMFSMSNGTTVGTLRMVGGDYAFGAPVVSLNQLFIAVTPYPDVAYATAIAVFDLSTRALLTRFQPGGNFLSFTLTSNNTVLLTTSSATVVAIRIDGVQTQNSSTTSGDMLTYQYDGGRTGVYPYVTTRATPPTLRWRQAILASSISFAIAGTTLYASYVDSYSYPRIAAFDLQSGSMTWQLALDSAITPTISAPSIAQATVFVYSTARVGNVFATTVAAISLGSGRGRALWSTTIGVVGYYVYTNGPLVSDGRIWCATSVYNGANTLLAFNATVGVLLISQNMSAPVISISAGTERIYVQTTKELGEVDQSTGEFLWSLSIANPMPSSPLVVSSGFAVFVYAPVTSTSKFLVAINLKTQEVQWNISQRLAATPAIFDGAVYISNGTSVIAYDLTSGQLLGVFNFTNGDVAYAAPIVTADQLIIACQNYDTIVSNSAYNVYFFDRRSLALQSQFRLNTGFTYFGVARAVFAFVEYPAGAVSVYA